MSTPGSSTTRDVESGGRQASTQQSFAATFAERCSSLASDHQFFVLWWRSARLFDVGSPLSVMGLKLFRGRAVPYQSADANHAARIWRLLGLEGGWSIRWNCRSRASSVVKAEVSIDTVAMNQKHRFEGPDIAWGQAGNGVLELP